MRTTLINTTFWKEESIDHLHLDSKLLYLFMITNPDKGLANIYYYRPKVISAYCGLSIEQLNVAVKQLLDLGYIDIFEGFYTILKGHEMPKKGRFTQKTIEKEKSEIPKEVLAHFHLNLSSNSSGVAPEHKDKDKYINNTNDKSKSEINELFGHWLDIVGYKIESQAQNNRFACSNLLKKHGRDRLLQLLRLVADSQSDQYAPRVSDFVSLQAKISEMLAWEKRRSSTKPQDPLKKYYKPIRELGLGTDNRGLKNDGLKIFKAKRKELGR